MARFCEPVEAITTTKMRCHGTITNASQQFLSLRLTAFQLLTYIVRIWEKRLRDGLDLCPMIPLVVYHGERPWSAARNLRELLASPNALAEYQVDFRFSLLDLGQLPDAEIVGEPILQSTLRLLKYSRSQQLLGMLGELLLLISQSLPEINCQTG